MSTLDTVPLKPPPAPPHASPPPPHAPGGVHLPTPPAGMTGPATHSAGVILGVGTPKTHKPVYRVGETATGGSPTTTPHATDVIAALQAFLQAHAGAVAAGGETPAMPQTFTVTATAENASDGSQAPGSGTIPVDQPPHHPTPTGPPLFKPGMVPPTVHDGTRGLY